MFLKAIKFQENFDSFESQFNTNVRRWHNNLKRKITYKEQRVDWAANRATIDKSNYRLLDKLRSVI